MESALLCSLFKRPPVRNTRLKSLFIWANRFMKLNKGKDSSAARRERVLLGWFHCSADRIIVTVTLIDSDRPLFLLFSAGKATERMASWHRCVREIIQIPLWGWIFIASLIFHYSFLLLFLRYVHVPHLFCSKTPMISCFIHRISTILMMDFLCSLLFIYFACSILNTNIFAFPCLLRIH